MSIERVRGTHMHRENERDRHTQGEPEREGIREGEGKMYMEWLQLVASLKL